MFLRFFLQVTCVALFLLVQPSVFYGGCFLFFEKKKNMTFAVVKCVALSQDDEPQLVKAWESKGQYVTVNNHSVFYVQEIPHVNAEVILFTHGTQPISLGVERLNLCLTRRSLRCSFVVLWLAQGHFALNSFKLQLHCV